MQIMVPVTSRTRRNNRRWPRSQRWLRREAAEGKDVADAMP
jgi:hypothetical protein